MERRHKIKFGTSGYVEVLFTQERIQGELLPDTSVDFGQVRLAISADNKADFIDDLTKIIHKYYI